MVGIALWPDSFGSWNDRDYDGAAYVDGLRRGMARRLADE